jgi:hypothetical protein
LELKSIDQMYLDAYAPKLTSEKEIAGYFGGFSQPSLRGDEIGGGQERVFCARDQKIHRWPADRAANVAG